MLQLQVKDLHQGGFSIEIHQNETVGFLKLLVFIVLNNFYYFRLKH